MKTKQRHYWKILFEWIGYIGASLGIILTPALYTLRIITLDATANLVVITLLLVLMALSCRLVRTWNPTSMDTENNQSKE